MKVYDGSITFVSGNCFFIYVHGSTGFEQFKYKKVDLGTRHNKGGQSQHRHERNYDIVKNYYIDTIVEATMELTTLNNWIFGSLDMIDKIIEKNPRLQNGGFVSFDSGTINDSKKWTEYLKDNSQTIQIKKEDKLLENIITLIETDPDRLDFDPNNKDLVDWYMVSKSSEDTDNRVIYLNPRHKHYAKLREFEYIGVKYIGQDFDF